MGSRREKDAAEIRHLAAQDVALQKAAQQEAARTAIAGQEQATRAAAQRQAAREGEAKIAQERELTPFQKMLSLSQAGAPAQQERSNKIKAAIDVYQTMAQTKAAREQIQGQKDIETSREKGAMERQKEQSRGNVTDAMITHLATRPDIVDPAVFREALKQRGSPELANAYDKVREPLIQSQVDTLKPQLQVMHQKGHLDAGLQSVTDPDVRKRLQPYIDELTKTPAAVAPAGNPEYPGYGGGIADTIKYAPIDIMNFAAAGENATAVPFMNVLNSLLGAPPVKRRATLPRDYEAALKIMQQP